MTNLRAKLLSFLSEKKAVWPDRIVFARWPKRLLTATKREKQFSSLNLREIHPPKPQP